MKTAPVSGLIPGGPGSGKAPVGGSIPILRNAAVGSMTGWELVVVSEGTGAAPCAVASCGAAPGRVSSDDVRTDVGVTGGPMFAGGTSEVTSNESVPCRAAPCKSQGTAAEVESEVMGDGDTTSLHCERFYYA